jgi:hypothetical protein
MVSMGMEIYPDDGDLGMVVAYSDGDNSSSRLLSIIDKIHLKRPLLVRGGLKINKRKT